MAATTATNAPIATTSTAITGAGEFLKFVSTKLPSLFVNHPVATLGGTPSARVVSWTRVGDTVYLVVDCYGGEFPVQWRLSGLILQYRVNPAPETENPGLARAIAEGFIEREKFDRFTVRSGVDYKFLRK